MRNATAAPHCDAIHAAHIARVTVETLVGRPLSHANTPFIDACLRNLGMLADRLDDVRPELAVPHDAQAADLARQLRAVALAPGQDEIHACGHYIRESFGLYAGLMRVDRPRTEAPADPLHGMRPRAIVVAIGPGLGIGDEIKLRPLLQRLERHFALPADAMHVFSYCPAIWRTLQGDWQTGDLGSQPMAAFDRLTVLRGANPVAGQVLMVFCNFLRRNGLRTMLPYENWHDVLDISVGSGEISIHRHGQRSEMHWCGMDLDHPCLSRALHRMGRYVLPRGEAPLSVAAPSPARQPWTRGMPFRILISPFTSKRSPHTAHDWAECVAAMARALPGKRPVRCTVLPGLTAECRSHAQDIASLVSYRLNGRGHAELARPDGLLLTADNAMSYVTGELARSDLLLGIDTYTAHLAAETGTPSIALCLEHNPRFWAPSPWTFWFNLQTGPHSVMQAARAVTRLLDPDARTGLPFAGLAHAASTLARSGGLGAADAVALLDQAWQALPPGVQRALERLDDQYSWPQRRPRLQDHNSPRERDLLSRSNFLRLLGLAEPSLWSNNDHAAH